jgi:pantothenate kinase
MSGILHATFLLEEERAFLKKGAPKTFDCVPPGDV